jgi:hypothetical protein
MCQLAYGVASLVHERPATVFSMRRSITAVASVVVAFAAVGCSGSGGGSSLASTTTTPVVTTAPAATTTEAPSTTPAPTTTTTAVITDATTADPKALATQLQAVVDRYQELYLASRTDPERPFTDQQLIDDFHEVAGQDELADLVMAWGSFRQAGSAVKAGPNTEPSVVLTSLSHVSAQHVDATFCYYDDGVTFAVATGNVLDDATFVGHGAIGFDATDGRWKVAHWETVESANVPSGSPDPCTSERIA